MNEAVETRPAISPSKGSSSVTGEATRHVAQSAGPSIPPANPRTRAEILQEANGVLEDIARIKEQLGRAKGRGAEGDYSDADWFQRTSRALRHKQIYHQRLLQEIAAMRREQIAIDRSGFDSRLITLLKAAMPPEQFRKIVDQAMANEQTKDPAELTDDELLSEVESAAKRIGRGTSVGADQGIVSECARRLAHTLERIAHQDALDIEDESATDDSAQSNGADSSREMAERK